MLYFLLLMIHGFDATTYSAHLVILRVLPLEQLKHRLEVGHLVRKPTYYDLCTTNFGD